MLKLRWGMILGAALMVAPAYGGQEGHGGDIAVSTFLGVANKTLLCLKGNPDSWKASTPMLADELEAAIQKTQVYSVDRTVLNGQEVDAINYPDVEQPRILINRDRWLDPRLDSVLRAHLVVHEYLSIIGYDDSRYSISYPVVQKNKQCINQEEEKMKINSGLKMAVAMATLGVLGANSPAKAADDTIVLGQYIGKGKLVTIRKDESQNQSEYENTCRVALNIDHGGDFLSIPFGVFACQMGMDTFNEAPIFLAIKDGALLKNGEKVGAIEADGSIHFSLDSEIQAQVRVSHVDQLCIPIGMEVKKVALKSRLSYELKPMGEAGYELKRVAEQDELGMVYKKEFPHCLASAVPSVSHLTRTVEATIGK